MSDSDEGARLEVVECEREIQTIKTALRKVAAPSSPSSEEAPNKLEVIWLSKSEDFTGDELSLQLSSPIEEVTLTKVYQEGEESNDGAVVSFDGVETSVATLTVTLRKDGQLVGTSESYDLAPLCRLEDVMNPQDEYVKELPVAILSPENASNGATAEETKQGDDEAEKPADKEAKIIKPLCTLALRLMYKPSAKDQIEELYELLNKTSQRKAQALEKLRDRKMALATASPSSSPRDKQQAVKSGFLNKTPKKEEESKWMKWYNKTLGPQSLARAVYPIAKNWVIFFAAVGLMHFKGQELALPAPV